MERCKVYLVLILGVYLLWGDFNREGNRGVIWGVLVWLGVVEIG